MCWGAAWPHNIMQKLLRCVMTCHVWASAAAALYAIEMEATRLSYWAPKRVTMANWERNDDAMIYRADHSIAVVRGLRLLGDGL
jgi:hypothetical protein